MELNALESDHRVVVFNQKLKNKKLVIYIGLINFGMMKQQKNGTKNLVLF
jgi:hypothetical protein